MEPPAHASERRERLVSIQHSGVIRLLDPPVAVQRLAPSDLVAWRTTTWDAESIGQGLVHVGPDVLVAEHPREGPEAMELREIEVPHQLDIRDVDSGDGCALSRE